MPIKKTVYITEDGEYFDDKGDAESHEQAVRVFTALEAQFLELLIGYKDRSVTQDKALCLDLIKKIIHNYLTL